MSSANTDIENYAAEFNGITEKLENGRDVCDLMTGFWEKLAKIEQAYSKQLVELCKGRYARLETLLGQTKLMFAGGAEKPSQPASLEHIGSLQDCWVKVVDEVQRLAAEHETLASHVTTKVTPTITKFVRDKLKDEVQRAATGKRLLTEARTGYQRVTATKRKYYSDVSAAAGKATTAGAGDSEGDADSEPPSKQAYEGAVKDLAEKHDEIFMVGLPGVLRDINLIEQDRAQMLCSCMNQYIQSAAALKNALTFDATAAALEATTKDPAVTQLVMMSPVPTKPEVEAATEDSIKQEQGEAQSASLLTAMSGWLSSKRTVAGGDAAKEPASAEAAEDTANEAKSESKPEAATSEGESTTATSKLTSFFSGWGRKSKPQPAAETKVDAPGLVDSIDGPEATSAAEKEDTDEASAAADNDTHQEDAEEPQAEETKENVEEEPMDDSTVDAGVQDDLAET
ncbi:uncharacterized protein LOC135812200 [Sycon ciliatum]|uniref:uncharacterized protein LOC135812200 n=1 Tax=Sycon ciliatum TaxID=27933 RepID=UPI0020A89778|eukprot:scpid78275/ scgid9611/ 